MGKTGSQASLVHIKSQLLILLLIVLMTLALTYPVATEVFRGSALPGLKDFDEFEYMWLIWWYKVSLVERQSDPANLPFYYPMQTHLPLVTVTPLGWLIPIPLVLLCGPMVAYVVYWLLNFVLCGYTAYLLALWLTRSRTAAFIGGLIFAFYPGKMLHGLGHMGDMMIFMFPLYVLFLMKFVEQPSVRSAALLAIVTSIGLLIDFRHIGLFYLPITVIYLLFLLVTAPTQVLSFRLVRLTLLALVVVLVATLPFFLPFVLSSLGGQLGHLKEGGLEASSADVLSFLLPPMTNPVWGQIPPLKQLMDTVWRESLYIETCLYLGLVTTGLAVVALVKRKGKALFWLVVVVVGMVIALGPVLKVGGVQFAGVKLPYAYLSELPFYEWLRIPGRMDMMIKLALGMLAALGARELLRRQRPTRQILSVAVLSGVIIAEYLTFVPYPLAKVAPAPFLETLANDGQDYGIMHIASHEYAMYLQTLHGHKMVEGHIHRWPPGGIEWALQLHGQALYPPQSEQPYYDIVGEELPYGRDAADIFAGKLDVSPANLLSRLNIRYIVFDRKSPWTKQDQDLYAGRLEGYFGKPIHEDKRLSIYDTRLKATGGTNMVPVGGWYALEGGERDRWRWMADRAAARIDGAGDSPYRLQLSVFPEKEARHLKVVVGDREIGEYLVNGAQDLILPEFVLPGRSASIEFAVEEGCRKPFSLLQGQLDGRCLGIAFNEIRLFPSLKKPRSFGGQIDLVGQEWTRGIGQDNNLYLTLYWQAGDRMSRDYTVFVHVLDAQGRVIAQDDQRLVTRQGMPTSAWKEGWGTHTLHQLTLPPDVQLDQVRILLGLYDVQNMERVPLRGDESGENAVVITGTELVH